VSRCHEENSQPALCTIAGVAATAVSDANAQAPAGLKRAILANTEYPDSKYATAVQMLVVEGRKIWIRD
jgi:hypothetical protein